MEISPLAGKSPPESLLINVPQLIAAYYEAKPNPEILSERVSFGTSGHRGSSLHNSFNENHILAMTQAICLYRQENQITGPLFLGKDTHALSDPALKSALEVLAANGVTVMLSQDDAFTPTPAISLSILDYNKGRKAALADGIVITPSHNPPAEGGFKYNPPNGGPAEPVITTWIENRANEFLKNNLRGVKKIPFEQALKAPSVHRHDFMSAYVEGLASVIDFDVIRASHIKLGVDPLGGAGVHYWGKIAERYGIDLTVVNTVVDPTFRFMCVDWDGKIRMDPSSAYAMNGLIQLKNSFDVAFACDTDYDRHGIVTKSCGLLPPNHFLSVAIHYLFQHRSNWKTEMSVGKTVVSSQMIDRVTAKLGRKLMEVPVGFKWFVEGLLEGNLGFVGEESAGAAFLRKDGTVWTTDKDGMMMALLSAEITARMGKDPGQIYQELTHEFGTPLYSRLEAPATPKQKEILKKLSPDQVKSSELGGEKIISVLTKAPGNHASIGGLKVSTANGWFAARPSGTEEIYKIYAESYLGEAHLLRIQEEAQRIVSEALETSL